MMIFTYGGVVGRHALLVNTLVEGAVTAGIDCGGDEVSEETQKSKEDEDDGTHLDD